MTAATDTLPITDTIEPADVSEIARLVSETPKGSAIYPVGGGTSLSYGLPAKIGGVGVSLRSLSKVIDYPARDMTITVEAGITMRELAATLAAENQRLPINVPHAEQATLGGVIATNWNGPRRFGQGTVRDYVIGISAVDGHGTIFKGGGRVVKNVAGYDFCKLLTGSLGTLGIITQATLKVRPIPEESGIVVWTLPDASTLDAALAKLSDSVTTPTAIEVVSGSGWDECDLLVTGEEHRTWKLLVGVEGTAAEVDWMVGQLETEMRNVAGDAAPVERESVARVWDALASWSAAGEFPLVLKASVLPSKVVQTCEAYCSLDANCSLQAHAGNGVVIAKLSEFPADGLSRALLSNLQPLASSDGGNIVVLSNPSAKEMTHQSAWGGIDVPFALMTKVKQQFDPKNILNPGRFVYV